MASDWKEGYRRTNVPAEVAVKSLNQATESHLRTGGTAFHTRAMTERKAGTE